jgi:hypothetical protein
MSVLDSETALNWEREMDTSLLAHGSGLDEMVVFGFPIVVGIGFWLIIRKKPDDEGEEQPPE